MGAGIAAAQSYRRKCGEKRDALLHSGEFGAAQQLARHARGAGPLATIELEGCVVRADVRAVREDSPLFAILYTLTEYLLGTVKVVYQHRIEEQRAVRPRGVVFEPFVERQRDTAVESLVSPAIAGPQNRPADVTQRMRLGCAVADFAGELQRALSIFQRFLVPATMNREERSPAVGHCQSRTARQGLQQANGGGHAVIGIRLIAYRAVFLREQA